MSFLRSYRLRLRRRRLQIRALQKKSELKNIVNNISKIDRDDVLVIATLKDELVRLPFFLDYYRKLGAGHFLLIDNNSSDGSADFLKNQPDVSLWSTAASYKTARYGLDWINWLLRKYGRQRWCLIVDMDEFFVYPFCDTRPLRALTEWLDNSSVRSFGAMQIDMYPKGELQDTTYEVGQNPFEIAKWFDTGNYTFEKNENMGNLWIQGGPRARKFFPDAPKTAPALNKIPLVKWQRGYVYESSTHMLLPRGLNQVYEFNGGEKASGVLLHFKLFDSLSELSLKAVDQEEHYANSYEYQQYLFGLKENSDLWNNWSEQYINWRQLEILGLMSKGNWA